MVVDANYEVEVKTHIKSPSSTDPTLTEGGRPGNWRTSWFAHIPRAHDFLLSIITVFGDDDDDGMTDETPSS